jgi:primosomal protein N'
MRFGAGENGTGLVPEIALTPRCFAVIPRTSGAQGAFSQFPEYGRALRRMEAGPQSEARVVVGTRSASVCASRDLGVLIVDEEQEPT